MHSYKRFIGKIVQTIRLIRSTALNRHEQNGFNDL